MERLVKTFKHGLTILSTNPEHAQDWDKNMPKILFGYRCGVQMNTKFSPHMLLSGRTPRLKANNFLNPLVQTYYDDENTIVVTTQMDQQIMTDLKNAWRSFRKHLLGPSQIKMGICF